MMLLEKNHTLDMLKAEEITLTEKFREEKAQKIKTNTDLLEKLACAANTQRRRASIFRR